MATRQNLPSILTLLILLDFNLAYKYPNDLQNLEKAWF